MVESGSFHWSVLDVGLARRTASNASRGTSTLGVSRDIRRVHGHLWTLDLDLAEHLGTVHFWRSR